MDKKNLVLGLLFLGGAFFTIFWQGRQAQERALQQQLNQPAAQKVQTAEAGATEEAPATAAKPATPAGKPAPGDTTRDFFLQSENNAQDIEPVHAEAPEELITLENEAIRVTFTTRGGAIKHVEFVAIGHDGELKFPATIDSEQPYVFNAGGILPALAISFDMDGDGVPDEFAPQYKVSYHSNDEGRVNFELVTDYGLRIKRGYQLQGSGTDKDPYVIQHTIAFVNESGSSFNQNDIFVNVGTAPPTEGDVWGEYLNFGYYNGDSAEFIKMKKFKGSKGFLGIGKKSPVSVVEESVADVQWGAIKNQFFTGVLTPTEPGIGIYAKPAPLGQAIDDPEAEEGMTGAIRFRLDALPQGEQQLFHMQYYVGPKEYTRLADLGDRQDLVMQFGFFGAISKVLLYAMIWIHGVIVHVAPTWGWGFTIIIVTVIIKTLLYPLTQVQVRSAKRMSKIQPLMQEIREKYKDQPQELQKRTMELFKEHRVNPAAGCLPLLLQIPIFFSFYFMLRTASELRFAPFLWIPDLSIPDTVGYIAGFPINPLPLLMGITMFFQMQMTPTPTTDNMQRTLFKFMPLVFLFFCYNFPAGLVLYWTCQNLFTIGQQWITNRRKDDEEETGTDKPASGPKKPTFTDRVKAAREEQQAAKRRLTGKGLPQQKKKKR
ncbi:membrane protein insertase YidC [Ruficoccus amylovorans]|uniref:Membrane protein insertase YidC n=1 Tax=Ruficoccus amylovorans TaxID=1804625 RepID=A0A842HL33_9BACT|nr:membrane protein insertase YidC [Ruficoccus amylovorans]MBC2596226.1 membrane protein insertase YidC [Ruficoccus amylovorans]